MGCCCMAVLARVPVFIPYMPAWVANLWLRVQTLYPKFAPALMQSVPLRMVDLLLKVLPGLDSRS